jgi:hypothetical protein
VKSPIRRTRPLIEFVQIPNLVARDYRLSYRARGLLVELLSYPPGWETTIDEMAARAKRESDKHDGCRSEGRDAMRAAARELEHVGYLKRTKYRDEMGRWVTETVISEDPLMAFALEQTLAPQSGTSNQDGFPVLAVTCENEPTEGEITGQSQDGFPGVGKPGVGKPGVIRKTEKKTDTSTSRLPKPRPVPDPAPATTEAAADLTSPQLQQAAAFLQQLPGRWAPGRKTARDLAPLLLEAAEAQGWQLDADLTAKLTEDLGPVRAYAGALKHRIEDLPRRATIASAPRPVRSYADPTYCGLNGCDYGQIERPDGSYAPCPCTRKATAA